MPSSVAADEPDVDQGAGPDAERRDKRDVEVDALVKAGREAQKHEDDRRAAHLKSDDRVDRARGDDDEGGKNDHREQCGRRDEKRVHAGFSEFRFTTRS